MGYLTAVYFASAELGTLSPTNSLLVSIKDPLPQPSTPSQYTLSSIISFLVSIKDPLPQPSTPSQYWGSCTADFTPLVNVKEPLE
jgi:hypothetical protein